MSNKRIRRLLKSAEELKQLNLPDRFKKKDNEIYGLIDGNWEKLEPSAIMKLKNAYKKTLEQRKRDRDIDIDVQILDDDTEQEQPLISFSDNYELYENGFQYVVHVGVQETR